MYLSTALAFLQHFRQTGLRRIRPTDIT